MTSPDYPANYPAGAASVVRLQTEPGSLISLNITHLHIQKFIKCGRDRLVVRDSDNSVVARLCGAAPPPSPVLSSGNKAPQHKSAEPRRIPYDRM